MGFMLGDPFNYSPVQKMAERVTFRTAADGKPNCPASCGNADVTARPYTLKQYYQEDMQSGGDFHHNRPLTRFFVRGDVTWKDDDYTLKLNDVAGSDGATKLDVEPGWLVKLKIGFKTGYDRLQTGDGTFNDMVADKLNAENPNILRVDNEASDAGYFYTIVLLDGDEGDYVSIDLDDEHGDIGQFVIKTGGIKYSDSTKLDYGSSDHDARVELLGVSYKPYFEEEEEDDNGTDEGTDDNTDDNTNNTIVSCYQNEDCLDGEICESGTCVEKIEGCTDPRANEYDSSANVENGTCISCQTGYDKDSDGLCTVCADGYTADAAGICYADDDEEEAFPWLYVAGIGAALVLVLS